MREEPAVELRFEFLYAAANYRAAHAEHLASARIDAQVNRRFHRRERHRHVQAAQDDHVGQRTGALDVVDLYRIFLMGTSVVSTTPARWRVDWCIPGTMLRPQGALRRRRIAWFALTMPFSRAQ